MYLWIIFWKFKQVYILECIKDVKQQFYGSIIRAIVVTVGRQYYQTTKNKLFVVSSEPSLYYSMANKLVRTCFSSIEGVGSIGRRIVDWSNLTFDESLEIHFVEQFKFEYFHATNNFKSFQIQTQTQKTKIATFEDIATN